MVMPAAKRQTGAPAAPRTPAAAARKPRSIRALVACPYCAEPLKVPPVASGKCPRCRLRIVVKRVGDRSIYLTEAALPVFMGERGQPGRPRRTLDPRSRSLARSGQGKRCREGERRPPQEAAASSPRTSSRRRETCTWRPSSVPPAPLAERGWEEAGRLRYDQALALYRIARSPRPVPDEVLAVHRDGLASSLRGIAEIAKYAELRAGACCDVCREDDGRTARISQELRAHSLPHVACEKGLCRCRWYLAARDRAIVSDLLKRQTRGPRQQRSAPGS